MGPKPSLRGGCRAGWVPTVCDHPWAPAGAIFVTPHTLRGCPEDGWEMLARIDVGRWIQQRQEPQQSLFLRAKLLLEIFGAPLFMLESQTLECCCFLSVNKELQLGLHLGLLLPELLLHMAPGQTPDVHPSQLPFLGGLMVLTEAEQLCVVNAPFLASRRHVLSVFPSPGSWCTSTETASHILCCYFSFETVVNSKETPG